MPVGQGHTHYPTIPLQFREVIRCALAACTAVSPHSTIIFREVTRCARAPQYKLLLCHAHHPVKSDLLRTRPMVGVIQRCKRRVRSGTHRDIMVEWKDGGSDTVQRAVAQHVSFTALLHDDGIYCCEMKSPRSMSQSSGFGAVEYNDQHPMLPTANGRAKDFPLTKPPGTGTISARNRFQLKNSCNFVKTGKTNRHNCGLSGHQVSRPIRCPDSGQFPT